MTECFDIVVVGGGPAGSAVTKILSTSNYRTLWIDDGAGHRRKVGETLLGSARPLLEQLEFIEAVQSGPHQPCFGKLMSWGSPALDRIDDRARAHGTGWHLDRPRFEADLRDAVLCPAVTFTESKVRDIQRQGEAWHLRLTRGQTVSGRFVVDATGWRSAIAHMLGARRIRDRRQVALCTWYKPPPSVRDRDPYTLIESAPQGWWYTARLPDYSRVAALHVDPEDAVGIVHSGRAWSQWMQETHHIHRKLDGWIPASPIQSVDASGGTLDTFYGEHWLATGDAAISLDPLQSQGISTALYTGSRAGRAIRNHLDGDPNALSAYAQRLDIIRLKYLNQQSRAYEGEYRWLDRRYWRRRIEKAQSRSPPVVV